jgi:Cu+-exporting ATPase
MHQPTFDPRRPPEKVTLEVSGMHCTNCALSLEKHLLRVGANAPCVDFATGRTSFTLDQPEKLQEIVKSISGLGYSVTSESGAALPQSRYDSLHLKTLIAALLTTPLLVAMFFEHSIFHNPWLQWVLATPVFIIGVLHFGASGVRSIRAGVANMDVLITLGVVAGYLASVLTLVFNLPKELIFFEATSSIVMFVLIGHLLEERAVRKTTTAIESLAALQPRSAKRLSALDSPTATTISALEIQVGDLLQVNSGDTIPTDAVIVQGTLSCNEMMLTGESLPVEKAQADKVVGGSIALDGSAVVRASAVGDDTVLASIVRLVQEAQQRKPSIQRIGDAVSAVFVPAVIIISITVLAAGLLFFDLTIAQAIVRALAIAVVACPCAMGLATPTAIMVALGRAATSGILIRGGDTLERLALVDHIAFDKTGTLTTGQLTLGKLSTYEGATETFAQGVIVALQRNSSHPIAKALAKAFATSSSALAFDSVVETKGFGISGRGSDGSTYICGGARVKEQHQILCPDDLVLLKDGKLIASLSFSDSVRPEALSVIEALRKLSISSTIISGDTAVKTEAVAKELQITNAYGEQLPAQKLSRVQALQATSPIAYVGDGINDAPTLAEASVGISLSSASDVAMHSAQVILSGNTLNNLPAAVKLARITVRTIKQNLFWAFLYNIVAIPLAAFGYIAPLTGALLMTFSDVVIVANSLRIKLTKL